MVEVAIGVGVPGRIVGDTAGEGVGGAGAGVAVAATGEAVGDAGMAVDAGAGLPEAAGAGLGLSAGNGFPKVAMMATNSGSWRGKSAAVEVKLTIQKSPEGRACR